MSKHEASVSVPASTIADLIAAAVDRRVAEILTGKGPDEKIAEAMAAQRGQNVPPLAEAAIECVSPITGARFTARMLTARSPGSPSRVVELLDYERPEGWDRSVDDGGRVPRGTEIRDQFDKYTKKFMLSVFREFYARDVAAIGGKPLPEVWRASYAPVPGSVTLTPAQMTALGISPEQIAAALEEKGETEKAAE